MKGFYRLLNLEFVAWARFLAILLAASLALPYFLLRSATSDYSAFANHARYESLYATSGCQLLFLLSLVVLCVYFLLTIYASYWGSRSIYTYLTLPLKRDAYFWSKAAVFGISLLLLIGVQYLVFRFGYAYVDHRIASYDEAGQFAMHNGLYLAELRSDFMRLLLPQALSRSISTISVLLAVLFGLYYGALCERSRQFYGLAAVAAAAVIIVRVLQYRMNESMNTVDLRSLLPSSILLLLLTGWFIGHGLYLIRRGAIA